VPQGVKVQVLSRAPNKNQANGLFFVWSDSARIFTLKRCEGENCQHAMATCRGGILQGSPLLKLCFKDEVTGEMIRWLIARTIFLFLSCA
jgi:hypothetical protein